MEGAHLFDGDVLVVDKSISPVPEPTADTRTLTNWALRVLRHIYRSGFAYKKAGVMLTELRPVSLKQGTMDGPKHSRQHGDAINHKWGRGPANPFPESSWERMGDET